MGTLDSKYATLQQRVLSARSLIDVSTRKVAENEASLMSSQRELAHYQFELQEAEREFEEYAAARRAFVDAAVPDA